MREEFTNSDVIYKTVVLIQNGFAISRDIEICEKRWRYLLNMFPEVEKDVPPDIMESINKYKAEHKE
jgi:hypothetical protein